MGLQLAFSFFLLFSSSQVTPPPPWSGGGGCGGLRRSLRELLSVSEWSRRMPLSAASFCRSLSRRARRGGVGWGWSSGCGPGAFEQVFGS